MDGSSNRGANSNGQHRQRILCPVAGCPDAIESSHRYFRNFLGIKSHLNDHCTGHLTGAVPISFLTQNNYSLCEICNKVLHTRFHGTCPKCRPYARTRDHLTSIRVNGNTPINSTHHGHVRPKEMRRAICPVFKMCTNVLFLLSKAFTRSCVNFGLSASQELWLKSSGPMMNPPGLSYKCFPRVLSVAQLEAVSLMLTEDLHGYEVDSADGLRVNAPSSGLTYHSTKDQSRDTQ